MSGSAQGMRRHLLIAAAAIALATLAPASSASGHGGIDRSFGANGVVDLSYEPSRGVYSVADAVGTAPDGGIYVLGATTPCLGCGPVRHLIRLRRNGVRDMGYGGDGTVKVRTAPYSSYYLLVDGRGRQIVAYVNERELVLARLRPNGALDGSFGGDGSVRFACDCSGSGAELRVNPPGRLEVAVTSARRKSADPAHRVYGASVETRRLLADGRLDPDFGVGGVATYRIENAFPPTTAIRLRGGGLAIAGGNWSGAGGVYAGRVGPTGRLDEAFVRKARGSLSARLRRQSRSLFGAGGLMPRGRGRLDVFGQVGFEGFVARLRRDGSLERRFGSGGIRLLPWTVDETLAGPGSRVFALGDAEGPTTVAWLGGDGRPLRSFAGGRGLEVEGVNSEEVTMVMQRGSRPLVLSPGLSTCRSYCPPEPRLYRFTRWAR